LIFLLNILDLHQHYSFGSTHQYHSSGLAFAALQSQGYFFSSFSFLSEDGFGLTSISGLFAVITSSSLSLFALFSLLVLRNFMHSVSAAFATVGLSGFGNYHHFMIINILNYLLIQILI
jgi:hypothetical protein